MIYRLLILFLIVWFLFWIIKKQFSLGADKKPSLKSDQSEDMIACAHCGTHVPRSSGVESDGKFYCSREHAESGPT
jgi:uncharacterized protein